MKPILYFNDKTGESLNLGDQLKVVGYKYEHNTISEKLFRESLSIFKRDIKHFKSTPFNPAWNRPYDDVFIEFREGYWLITKLIHLYDVLVKEGRFKQPFVIDPNKEKLLSCGHGRTLIGYRYFPYLKKKLFSYICVKLKVVYFYNYRTLYLQSFPHHNVLKVFHFFEIGGIVKLFPTY